MEMGYTYSVTFDILHYFTTYCRLAIELQFNFLQFYNQFVDTVMHFESKKRKYTNMETF